MEKIQGHAARVHQMMEAGEQIPPRDVLTLLTDLATTLLLDRAGTAAVPGPVAPQPAAASQRGPGGTGQTDAEASATWTDAEDTATEMGMEAEAWPNTGDELPPPVDLQDETPYQEVRRKARRADRAVPYAVAGRRCSGKSFVETPVLSPLPPAQPRAARVLTRASSG